MKKALSLLLSLLMIFTLFTCLCTAQATAADETPSAIIQDFEGITYLDATNGTQRDPDGVEAKNSHGEMATDSDGNTYLKILDSQQWVRYVNNAKENGLLKTDGTVYTLSFKYRLKAGQCTDPTGKTAKVNFWNHNATSYPNNATTSPANGVNGVILAYDSAKENEWQTAIIYNVAISHQYVQMQLPGSTKMEVHVDDIVFTEAVTATVSATGLGSATVDKTNVAYGETVTYQAKPTGENCFIGWVDQSGATLSTALTYSFVYDGTQDVTLTAKFVDGIVQNFENITYRNATNGTQRDPDGVEAKNSHGDLAKDDDGNTYLKISDDAQWVRYVNSETENGLLKTDGTKYTVSFKYRLKAGQCTDPTGKTAKVNFWNHNATNYSGSSSASPANGVNGVVLAYDSAKENEWRTAVIYNLPITDDYVQLQIPGSTKLELHLDDFVFTEAVTATAEASGVGTASVSQTDVAFGDVVTFTATEKNTDNFYGWYDASGDLVTTDPVYSMVYNGTQSLQMTAKFTGTVKQDFEGITYSNDRDPDGISEAAKYTHGTLVTADNNSYIEITNDNKWIQFITNDTENSVLKTSDKATYNVSFRYRIHSVSNVEEPVKIYFCGWEATPEWSYISESGGAAAAGVSLYYDAQAGTQWQTATIRNLRRNDTDGYLRVNINRNAGNSEVATIDLDDFVFTEVMSEETKTEVSGAFVKKNLTFDGTAMRAEANGKAQAMRFKNTISRKELDEKGYLGYEVVEYGYVVANTKTLANSGEELTLDIDQSVVPILSGAAYQKGVTDVRFALLEDGSVQFTLALTDIAVANYGDELTARTYVKLQDGSGSTFTAYGDAQSYCVYEVMWAVELYGSDEEKAVVTEMCNDAAVATGFAAYKDTHTIA